jgi:hypothetical protein
MSHSTASTACSSPCPSACNKSRLFSVIVSTTTQQLYQLLSLKSWAISLIVLSAADTPSASALTLPRIRPLFSTASFTCGNLSASSVLLNLHSAAVLKHYTNSQTSPCGKRVGMRQSNVY